MCNLNESDYMSVAELRQRGMWEGRYISAAGLIPIVRVSGEGLRGVEIGVCRGENIVRFLEQCPNIGHVDAVDPYIEFMDDHGGMSKQYLDRMKEIALDNFAAFPGRVTLRQSTSSEFARQCADGVYDYVFIDGNHSYECVVEDIRAWYPKLKSGGVFAGHDWHLDCVKRAVFEYRHAQQVAAPLRECAHSVWWWTK